MFKNFWLKTKKLVPFLLLGACVSTFVLARPVSSNGPEFNIFSNDPKTFRVANSSQNTEWLGQVNATGGETVTFLVYYHNGILNTTAENTNVRVALPTGPAQNFQAESFISADNTSKTVTDFATVNTDQNLNLSYIAGTTQIFRDGSQTGVALPDGIVSANGVNIGDIQGCWNHAGYVTFQAKLSTPVVVAQGQLALQKMVANSTRDHGTLNWQKQTTAGQGEFVAFRLFISNPGQAALSEVNIKDILPAGLTYAPGTTFITRNGQNTTLPDGITSDSGINISNLATGANQGVYVVFQARVNITGDTTLINTAQATSGNLSATDTATVVVAASHTAIPTITKTVRNVTQSQNNFTTSANANDGDTVEFQVNVKNIGDLAITDLNVNDSLPSGLTFLGDQSNFVSIANGATQLTWHFDTIAPNETKTITFQAQVGQFTTGDYTLVNEAEVHTACCDVVKAYATVYVHVTPPSIPHYKLTKEVLNVTKNDGVWSVNNQAFSGDTLEYRIKFQNDGNVAENVKLTDNLPAVETYLAKSGTVKIDNQAANFSTDLFTTNGLNFNLKPGDSGEIDFKAKVMAGLACASQFENDAFLVTPSVSLKASAITQIICPQTVIQKPKALPSTGLADILPFSVLFGFANFAWFKRIKAKVSR